MQINQSAAVANWNLFFLYVSQKPKSCKVCIFATPCSPKTTFSHKNPHNLNHHHQRKVLLKVFAELSVECKLPISATEWKVVYGKTLISSTNNTSTTPGNRMWAMMTTRASNEGSQRFHNQGEGPYQARSLMIFAPASISHIVGLWNLREPSFEALLVTWCAR